MNYRTIGTCGNCGGPVVVPTAWWSVMPPEPYCLYCGATPQQSWGPVMPMNPPRYYITPKYYPYSTTSPLNDSGWTERINTTNEVNTYC